MAKNPTLQRLRRRLVYWGGRVAQGLFLVLPFDTALALGGGLGRLAFALLKRERRKTIQHLTLALGQEKQEGEIRAIARGVFVNAGRAAAEIALLPRWTAARLRERIHFENPGPVCEAAQSGRGVVILTAHFGNWELLGAYAVSILGWNAGVIARRLSNPHLDRLVRRCRERAGMKVFLRGDPPLGFFRHLVRGGVLAMLADQNFRKMEGIFVDFFGRPAHTVTGPAELIVRARVPWFVAVLQRRPDGRSYELLCDGPLPVPEGNDNAAKVRWITEEYTRRVEEIVRRTPDQWMWMHDRWRAKPSQ